MTLLARALWAVVFALLLGLFFALGPTRPEGFLALLLVALLALYLLLRAGHLEWFLARRYLTMRSQSRFLNLITVIAIGGVSVGVAALILVVGVMTGMRREIQAKILDTYPHVMILTYGEEYAMRDWRAAVEQARRDPEVTHAGPFVYTQGLITAGGPLAQGVVVRGVETDATSALRAALEERVVAGSLQLERRSEDDLPPIALGYRLGERLLTYPGDTVTLVSPATAKLTSLGYVPEFRRFGVVALVKTGMHEYDDQFTYMALDEAQRLAGLGTAVTGVEVRVQEPWRAGEVAARLAGTLGYPYRAVDWKQLNQVLFSALKLEKLGSAVFGMLIVLVAAFNIISTLVMVVADKTREIGILRSMGMTPLRILRIFLIQGLIVGVIGTTLGALTGIGLVWVQNRYGVIQIPPDVYQVDRLPVALDPVDIGAILAASLLITFAATIYPSLQASRLTPVEAIRHE